MLAQPLARHPMALHSYNDNRPNPGTGYDGPRWNDQVPLTRPYVRSVGSYAGGLTYAQHELLRQRKTPHGRVCEQQDLSAIDETLQLPAPKHLLLSRPSNGGDYNDTNFSHRPRYDTRQQSNQHCYTARPGNTFQQTPNTAQFEPAWSFPGGYDSMLNQNNSCLNGQRTYHTVRSQIPTVMPSALHTSFGPTAPAGQQYYGPYWPDGTFSPYRPAPMRDDRFFHWRHSRDLSIDSSVSFLDQKQILPDQYRYQAVPNPVQVPSGMVQGVGALQTLPPRDSFTPYASFQDRISSALDAKNQTYGISNHYRELPLPIDNTGQNDRVNSQDYTLRPSVASERIAYRDRTFSCAYRVYLELLAQLQRDSKSAKHQNGVLGQTGSNSKPSFFPKPPRRSTSHFTESTIRKPDARNGQLTNRSDSSAARMVDDDINRPTTAIQMHRRASDFGMSQRRPDLVHNGMGDSTRTNTQPLTSFASRIQDASMIPHSGNTLPSISAITALDAIESLCHDADPIWTDGMLLAGCLAYGLGNYSRALAWYQKVLKHDSSNVEAMSNLAATYVALGRREEAVHHWSAAIKLRPGYFEAVEHLVGLFVSTHRTRDAVSIIEYVESRLKLSTQSQNLNGFEHSLEDDSDDQSRTSSATISSTEGPCYDFELDRRYSRSSAASEQSLGFGAFGYAIPAADNGRLLALIHAKGNMLYSLSDNQGAASAFEDAILIATGDRRLGIKGVIDKILRSCISTVDPFTAASLSESKEPVLLSPERAQEVARRMFPPSGDLPGLEFVPSSIAHRAAVSTTSNSLLSLAKIYQDGLCAQTSKRTGQNAGTREILALYYLSLSLQPSPSTANNVGILLASVQNVSSIQVLPQQTQNRVFNYTGIVPGSGIALALAYYNYGLNLDGKHAHLYTNLGSLLKDLGQLPAAIKMYETAVSCDGNFDIALANLANAVKDQGRIADAIKYYKRAVQANPDFAEAVCGLATALNSVCDWYGRGGVYANEGLRDKIHVDEHGMMHEARKGSGWMNKVVEIVDKQLRDGESWGIGILTPDAIELFCRQLTIIKSDISRDKQMRLYYKLQQSLQEWAGKRWEGSRVVRLIERAVKRIGWQWYQDRYKHGKEYPSRRYARPVLPANLPVPSAPTVLPFHTFTTPLSAKQVRQISQRNALRISVSTLKSSWLPRTVYAPPAPPHPCLRVGYVSSDFNNHPLAHLMQSIFGLHNPNRVHAHCYATSHSDNSIHRQQIEREAPVFHDATTWSVEKLVNQIVSDGIHILVNLNGYTRGAKNEVFAARPAPIHMSFMGFAGTLGAEWCDYVYADSISLSPATLSPYRYNIDIEDKLHPGCQVEDAEDWIYAENVIFPKHSFFCVDHKQSAPDAKTSSIPTHDARLNDKAWAAELDRRWKLRKELFPSLSDNAVILGNFNQLYKIDPTTYRMYLHILAAVPNAVLWLLRFPDVGEQNLKNFAREWAGPEVAERIIFTDVAPKGTHITRASVVDLFLDTPECNAHTTAADVIWSGTPIITWARWEYKMCSRMASSIVASALPEGSEGDEGRKDLLVTSEEEYEQHAIKLAKNLQYSNGSGYGDGRLLKLRRLLWEGRWTSRLFDTRRWVQDLEQAYWKAWEHWEEGQGGDIWM